MIEAVLFDLHGVLTSSPWPVLAAVGAGSGRSEAEILAVVIGDYSDDGDHPWHRLERGEIDMHDYAREVAALASVAGFGLDFGALAGFRDSITVHESVVAEVARLRASGFRTALVTNNVREMADGWRGLLDTDALFDAVIDSSSVGLRKPNPAIFTYAVDRLGLTDPGRAVFLDDLESNVAGALAAGLRGIVVHDPAAAVRDLRLLLRQQGT